MVHELTHSVSRPNSKASLPPGLRRQRQQSRLVSPRKNLSKVVILRRVIGSPFLFLRLVRFGQAGRQLKFVARRHGFWSWKSFGVVVGAGLVIASSASPADAAGVAGTLFSGAETSVTTLFTPYLQDTNIIAFVFGAARLFIYGAIIVLMIAAAKEGNRGQYFDLLVGALVTIVTVVAILQAASIAIFGS